MRLDRLYSNGLLLISVAVCLGYLWVGLYPFNFFQRNLAAWDPKGEGISFGRYAIAYGRNDLQLGKNGGVSVELLLRPGPQRPRHAGTILSLYDGETEKLAIRQRNDYLLVSVITRKTGGMQSREAVPKKTPLAGNLRFVSVTSGPAGTALFADAALVRSWSALVPDAAGLRGRLVLGSDSAGRSWRGKISGVAVFDRVLDEAEIAHHQALTDEKGFRALSSQPGLSALYVFDKKSGSTVEDYSSSRVPLVIPERYSTVSHSVLQPIWRERLDRRDAAINIVGFIPLGFFFFLYRIRAGQRRMLRDALATVALAAAVSLTIELLQVLLPSRSSSMSDLIFNILGVAIGVLLVLADRRMRSWSAERD